MPTDWAFRQATDAARLVAVLLLAALAVPGVSSAASKFGFVRAATSGQSANANTSDQKSYADSAATSGTATASARSLLFGAHTKDTVYDGDIGGFDALEQTLGRRVGIVLWYQNWGGGDWISSVQPHIVNAVTGSGRTPLLTWEPWEPNGNPNQPRFALARIARGDYDGYIRSFADGLRNLGQTINLRPMHEMNSNWYPWGGAVNGNSAHDYVAAWRRMHDIFEQAGATNVRWVWSPNNVDVPATPSNRMERYYPGARYVDILAVDGYNWGSTAPQNGGWQSFRKVFMQSYKRLSRLGDQPIWIAEVGAAPEGGSKDAWVRGMWRTAKRMRRLKAIVWFDENKERDWRATTVAAAFRG